MDHGTLGFPKTQLEVNKVKTIFINKENTFSTYNTSDTNYVGFFHITNQFFDLLDSNWMSNDLIQLIHKLRAQSHKASHTVTSPGPPTLLTDHPQIEVS